MAEMEDVLNQLWYRKQSCGAGIASFYGLGDVRDTDGRLGIRRHIWY